MLNISRLSKFVSVANFVLYLEIALTKEKYRYMYRQSSYIF
ncbi:hypothetical protein CCAND95_10066 [Capnocytophaga canis]|uniref:Uncharacterized protein n=1 Tax=Capnocytophaga canis TaxID=1848903 RepID=A0A0B7IV04_9FLAO|nr:hypothetical protein CCAND95_10066 [Capnocytophaga canis]CEN43145.1 hypothetical protein CCAND38_10064 [Capnocytophaga canis]CEN53758.1 hypothetical protein CCAND93_530060 [Capnocytophaga canis]